MIDFAKDVALLTIAHSTPAMLEHQFQAYLDNRAPDNQVVWVNEFNDAVWQVVQRYRSNSPANVTVVRTPNVGYHTPVDVVAEFVATDYLFVMPTDFRVTRQTWMKEFEALTPADAIGIPGSCSRSDNGVLCGPPAGIPWAWPPHLRSGGLLMRVDAFKAAGKFGVDGTLSAQEVRLSRMMLAMAMKVRVIEDAPLYDYGDWGRRHWPGISHGTLDDLKAFDAKFGVKAQDSTY